MYITSMLEAIKKVRRQEENKEKKYYIFIGICIINMIICTFL